MDKNAIKKFAINSRKELLETVRQSAGLVGITIDGISEKLPTSTSEIEYYIDDKAPLIGRDIQKRKKLVEELNSRAKKSDYKTAFTDLMEEVAYTWFNRIVAIRFMEVNDYLPSRTRVLSSTQNRNEPDIMIDPLNLEANLGAFSNDERQLISDAWDTEDPVKMDALYKMLFIKQVNALNKNLPYLFEKTNDYAELLFTPNYNRGVIKDIVTDIDEADFDVSQGGQVEIIGWIYQYYNTEPKNTAFKKNKYSESDIPAVTQLFTPDWIVKYLVENSLGRYWIDVLHSKGNEKSSKDIAVEYNWNYFIPAAKQDDEVQVKISNQQKELIATTIEDITLIDPAMGSGHILVYAFEVFMQIYMGEGYSKRDAAKLILKNNLFGLDIDTRAFQLAYFSIMMKARNYNRRILALDIVPNIHDIPEYRELDFQEFEEIIPDTESDSVKSIIESFKYGKDYGSLISTSDDINWDKLSNLENTINSGQMSFDTINFASDLKKLKDIITVAKLLSSK